MKPYFALESIAPNELVSAVILQNSNVLLPFYLLLTLSLQF